MTFLKLEVPQKAYFGGIHTPTKAYMIDVEAQRSETLSDLSDEPHVTEKTMLVKPCRTRRQKIILTLGWMFIIAFGIFTFLFACGLVPVGPRIYAPADIPEPCTGKEASEACAWLAEHPLPEEIGTEVGTS